MSGKTIVITGISRGLGRALTEEFLRLGHTVWGVSRDRQAVEALQKRYPGGRFDVVDVSSWSEVSRWAGERLAEGTPDIVINNAALINRNASLWEVPVHEFDQVIDVNLKGVFYVIKAFLPAMLQRREGVIVNMSSGWGRSTSPQVAPYCATKWAIEGLTKALAQELPSGMAAVPLNPGIIHTDMLESCFGEAARNYPSPETWAKRAAPFLLKLGPQHNGQSLSVPF